MTTALTATGAALIANPATHAVSVMPRTGRPIDVRLTIADGACMTPRTLHGSAIVYIFVTATGAADARAQVEAVIGTTGTVIETHTAASAATRVTIDPRLIAA